MSSTVTPLALAAAALSAIVAATESDRPPCTSPYKPFTYKGCYVDTSAVDGIFDWGPGLDYGSLTLENCTAACKSNGYQFAGLEYYGECYCASSTSTSAPEEDCNFPCKGDETETCGGFDRISVWQDPTFNAPMAAARDYHYVSCYGEGDGGRALPYLQNQLDPANMTRDLCLDACGKQGFGYAGLEWNRECYCGPLINYNATGAPEADCNTPCLGDGTQMCGGSGRLSLYMANSLISNEPCGYVPPIASKSSSQVPTPSASFSSSKSTQSSSSSAKTATPSSSSSSTPKSTQDTPATFTGLPPCTQTPVVYTPTKSSPAPPPPTASCACATASAWAGKSCVGNVPLPCVGCNDNSYIRPMYPFKLFNNRNFYQCPTYKSSGVQSACQDACGSQWKWCLAYADDCADKKKAGRKYPEDPDAAKKRCNSQYVDCWRAQKNVEDKGWCKSGKDATVYTSRMWYTWVNKWLIQFF